MDFKDWFCLNKRDSFTIDPKMNPGDAKFYFGRHEIMKQLKAQLRRSFIDPKVPKMIIFGPYGSGKTQLLYHIDYLLTNDPPETCKLKPHMIHLNIEMKSKSDHRHWHLQLMEALGKDIVTSWVEAISKRVPNIEDELKKIFLDPNLAEAMRKLLIGGLELTAWRWLCGQELAAKELEQLKVTRNLGYIGAGDMAGAVRSIGKLAEINGLKLVFMIDEAERFAAVKTGDGTEYLTDYLRELSEKSNNSVGFMLAGTAGAMDELPSVFVSPAVIRRLGRNNYIDIPYLAAVTDVKIFLKELLKELVDLRAAEQRIRELSLQASLETYPFDADSFDLLCQYATEDPTKALPSHLIHCLNECAISTWDEKKPVIEANVVNDVAPLIFG
jgi:hypothetical protein